MVESGALHFNDLSIVVIEGVERSHVPLAAERGVVPVRFKSLCEVVRFVALCDFGVWNRDVRTSVPAVLGVGSVILERSAFNLLRRACFCIHAF